MTPSEGSHGKVGTIDTTRNAKKLRQKYGGHLFAHILGGDVISHEGAFLEKYSRVLHDPNRADSNVGVAVELPPHRPPPHRPIQPFLHDRPAPPLSSFDDPAPVPTA